MASGKRTSLIAAIAGLGLILAYGYWIHPPGFTRGYGEDFTLFEATRAVMGQALQKTGHVSFVTDQLMAPFGTSMAFMPWSIERDWLGGLVWNWNKDFPFLWFYAVFSLLISYLGVGFILGRMGLSKAAAWLVATAVVLFHVPRHMKTWHHYEHLLQHWAYWGIFLDAWIWQKFTRDRVISPRLEVWRVVTLLGLSSASGYYWGPVILSWVLVHGWMAVMAFRDRGAYRIGRVSARQLVPPALISVFFVVLMAKWFGPLLTEVSRAGDVKLSLGWFGHFGYVFRPLWFELVYGRLPLPQPPAIDNVETVVTVGWFYWIPALLAIALVPKRRIAPFLALLVIAVVYFTVRTPTVLQQAIAFLVPVMGFFRVTSRWGLLLPQILTVITVLSWPELREWVRTRAPRALLVLFAVSSIAEARWLLYPVNGFPALPEATASMLNRVGHEPGTTVLDLPFCVAGGNAVCLKEQCAAYPDSLIGQGMRQWHEKKIYGFYEARMTEANCQVYNRAPYTAWFDAWRLQRCFTGEEWGQFCSYLDEHHELSAVLVYPGVWAAAAQPSCRAEFERHLGAPVESARLKLRATRGGEGAGDSDVVWFKPRCSPRRP